MLKYVPVPQTDIQLFDQNGYLIVRNALDSKTIQSLIQAGDRLINSNQTQNRQPGGEFYDSFRNSITLDDAFIPLITCRKKIFVFHFVPTPLNFFLVANLIIYSHVYNHIMFLSSPL